ARAGECGTFVVRPEWGRAFGKGLLDLFGVGGERPPVSFEKGWGGLAAVQILNRAAGLRFMQRQVVGHGRHDLAPLLGLRLESIAPGRGKNSFQTPRGLLRRRGNRAALAVFFERAVPFARSAQ